MIIKLIISIYIHKPSVTSSRLAFDINLQSSYLLTNMQQTFTVNTPIWVNDVNRRSTGFTTLILHKIIYFYSCNNTVYIFIQKFLLISLAIFPRPNHNMQRMRSLIRNVRTNCLISNEISTKNGQ